MLSISSLIFTLITLQSSKENCFQTTPIMSTSNGSFNSVPNTHTPLSAVIQHTSTNKLTSGTHKLKRNCINVHDIPTIDLTTYEDDEQQQCNQQAIFDHEYVGISKG